MRRWWLPIVLVLAWWPARAPAGPPPPPTAASSDARSPLLALGLSAGVTVAGVGLVLLVDDREFDATGGTKTFWRGVGWTGVVAFAVGPTTGRIYAGDPWNGGLVARALGVGVAVVGAWIDRGAPAPGSGYAVVIAGGLVYLGGAVYEIASAPFAVERRNRRRTKAIDVGLAPLVGAHETIPALTLSGQF